MFTAQEISNSFLLTRLPSGITVGLKLAEAQERQFMTLLNRTKNVFITVFEIFLTLYLQFRTAVDKTLQP